jgi:hypothetical protein
VYIDIASTPMDIETVRRISLARHLYQLGKSSLASPNDIYLFAAVNLLQDAVEAFLIAVADYVQVEIDQNTKFDKYFVLINDKISPKELPFKNKLLRLNRIRVDSKHYGIQPARDECDRVALSVREFLDEVSSSVLGVNFSTVSAIDLLDAGETKDLLLEAKTARESEDHATCLIACRKVLYVAVEHRYDVSNFKDALPRGLLAAVTYAPYYARDPKYIQENVKDPTDYIVRDHSRIDQDLLTEGVDTTAFWNVWRLTPEVYRSEDKQWVVKHDFAKLDAATLADNSEYVFSTTVDMALAIHASRKAVRWKQHGRYFLELAREGVPIYEKADVGSKVTATTPSGMIQIDTDYRVIGLKGDGLYWHVHEMAKDAWLWGYIHNDDVAQDAQEIG